ncbi:Negative regulator of genetic competence ClpC/MecB [compost metagenome]
MRRAIQKHIEDRLSEELLKGNIKKGDSLKIDEVNGELVVTTVVAPAAALEQEAEADNK